MLDGVSLEQIIEWRGKPACLRCDNGPEYIGKTMLEWAVKRRITIIHTQPGNPQQKSECTSAIFTLSHYELKAWQTGSVHVGGITLQTPSYLRVPLATACLGRTGFQIRLGSLTDY